MSHKNEPRHSPAYLALVTIVDDSLQQRIAKLEQEATPVAPPAMSRKKPAPGLPERLIDWRVFAGPHRIPQNEVRSCISIGFIHVEPGKWRTESGWVKEALDAQGQHDFWVQFNKHHELQTCDQFPH